MLLLSGGSVLVDGVLRAADVRIDGDRIVDVATNGASADEVIDCTGRVILPGFVDAHSHAEGLLDDPDVQRALLRQGVTTVIGGQDGVSFSPGDSTYAGEYFAAINGPRPTYARAGIGEFLDAVSGVSPVNLALLIPAGTVRAEVCGWASSPATPDERDVMRDLVRAGMQEGAVGLSTGLDYVPGVFQDASEIAALAEPVATAGGVYVTHMRGGYEVGTAAGLDEVREIVRRAEAATGAHLPAHISHLHADADIVLAELDRLADDGIDASFDAYPYVRGCSLLSMPMLPREVSGRPAAEVLAFLRSDAGRARIRDEWLPHVAENPSLGPDWPTMITFAHIDSLEYRWALGSTVAEASASRGVSPIDLVVDVLIAAELRVNIVMAVPHPRSDAELARIFAHPAHSGGSDGIFIGDHPHPRARGTFARFLRVFVREQQAWTWADASRHLTGNAVERFGLGARGEIRPGAIADIVVVDPETVGDLATYDNPLAEATGIDDVLVAGVPVVRHGVPTGALPGRGIRRGREHLSKNGTEEV